LQVQTLIKYLTGKRCHFYFEPAEGRAEAVILIHGLCRRSINLYHLGRHLYKRGYRVYVYDYQTTRHQIRAHSRHLLAYLDKVAAEQPDIPLHFVTHSMGGILLREALEMLRQRDSGSSGQDICTLNRVGRIVMLAPPHQGSDSAEFCRRHLQYICRHIRPLAELSSAPDSYIHRVPQPHGVEIGVITASLDIKVKEKYTRLEGVKEYLKVLSSHSVIMYMPKTIRAVAAFLEYGRFNPPD
jgi:pimeloyl-ACP methyl ester carboxylesterase